MYQYHEKATAYNVLLIIKEIREVPSTIGKRKNWTPSVERKRKVVSKMQDARCMIYICIYIIRSVDKLLIANSTVV